MRTISKDIKLMSEYTAENVVNAAIIMNTGKGEFVAAEKYIREFSKSGQAWLLTIQILQSQVDTNVQFQLLRILKSKILFDLISLTPIEVQNIFETCIQLIQRFSQSTEKTNRVQCSLILIYLYLYTYNQCTKSLLDFLQTDLKCSSRFVFDVIELFPEELLENKNLIIDSNRKEEIIRDIKQKQMMAIIEFLRNQWTQNQEFSLKFHILRAYKKWLEFMKQSLTETERIQFLQITGHQCVLFQGALSLLSDVELQDQASSVVCNLASLIPRTISNQPQLDEVATIIIQEIFNTFPHCQHALNEELNDELESYFKLYVKIGKKFMLPIILQVDRYIQGMLEIFQHVNSEEETETLSQFWLKFIQTLKNVDQAQFLKYQPVLEILINTCVIKTKVSLDYIQLFASNPSPKLNRDFEQKLVVRKNTKEIIEELTTIVAPNQIIHQLAKSLDFVQKDPQSVEGWILFEACLHLINGITKIAIVRKDQLALQYLKELINLVLNLNVTEPFLMKTIFKTLHLGGAEILSIDSLPQLFQFLTIGINSKNGEVQKRATKAFEMICKQKQDFVLTNIGSFLELIVNLQNISNFDNLIKGVANAICSDQAQITKYFVNLCSIFAKNLALIKQDIQTNQNTLQNKDVLKLIIKNLSSLTYIMNQVPQREDPDYRPVRDLLVTVYIELFPLFQYFMEQFSQMENEIPEKIVRFTKHTFRATFDSFSVELLTNVFNVMLSLYKMYPISSFIYCAEVSATVFFKYSQYHSILAEAFESMCTITFQHLPQLQSFEDNPDLTEDFFGMLVRYGRYTPSLVLQSPALGTLLQLTLIAIGIEHVAAAKAFYAWLEVIFKALQTEHDSDTFRQQILPEQKERLKTLLTPVIGQFLSKLFEALRKGPSDEEVEEYIEDCVNAISELNLFNYHTLLQSVLEEGPQTLLTASEKAHWLERSGEVAFTEKQQQYLELYTRRSLQSKQR